MKSPCFKFLNHAELSPALRASATVLELPVVLVAPSASPLVPLVPLLVLLLVLLLQSPRLRKAPWPFSVAIFHAAAKLATHADSSF